MTSVKVSKLTDFNGKEIRRTEGHHSNTQSELALSPKAVETVDKKVTQRQLQGRFSYCESDSAGQDGLQNMPEAGGNQDGKYRQ